MDIVIAEPISLLALREVGGFYPQDWYDTHEFARWQLPAGTYHLNPAPRLRGVEPREDYFLPTAALCAYAWLRDPTLWRDWYVWTCDRDDFGNRVYVGMTAGDGRSRPGFQVHRHLKIDDRWGSILCAG